MLPAVRDVEPVGGERGGGEHRCSRLALGSGHGHDPPVLEVLEPERRGCRDHCTELRRGCQAVVVARDTRASGRRNRSGESRGSRARAHRARRAPRRWPAGRPGTRTVPRRRRRRRRARRRSGRCDGRKTDPQGPLRRRPPACRRAPRHLLISGTARSYTGTLKRRSPEGRASWHDTPGCHGIRTKWRTSPRYPSPRGDPTTGSASHGNQSGGRAVALRVTTVEREGAQKIGSRAD